MSVVLLYALEACILSAIGFSWHGIKNTFFGPTFTEDYLIYSQSAVSIIHMVFVSLMHDKKGVCRGYFAVTLINWLFTVFIASDSWDDFTFDYKDRPPYVYNNTNSTFCCPNNMLAKWNQHVFFNGNGMYLVPLAVTFAWQTVHLVIAAASLINTQPTLNPGISLSHGIFAIAIMAMNLRFLGVVRPPCLSENVILFNGVVVLRVKYLLLILGGTFHVLAIVEDLLVTRKLKIFWSATSFFMIIIYAIVVYFNFKGYNIVSIPWLLLNALGFMAFIFAMIDIVNPTVEEIKTNLNQGMKTRTRFVLPMQTTLTPKNSKKD
jgi:hypothetical protein